MNEDTRRYHEVANLFPLMTGDAFDALKADIAKQGQLEAIWLHPDGSIIDGRNRHRACVELGIVPRFRKWDGQGSLVAFVVSLNRERRHMTASQLGAIAPDIERALAAEIAAELAERRRVQALQREEQKRKEAAVTNGQVALLEEEPDDDHTPQLIAECGREAREEAAAALGVNRQYVSDAKNLEQHAPDLLAQVKAGQITMPQAMRELKRRQKQAAEEARLAALRESQVARPVACRLVVARAEATTLDAETVDIIITSPPYNLGAEEWPMGGGGRRSRDGIDYAAHADDMAQDVYECWQVDVLRELYRVAKPGASFFYNHKVRTVDGVMVHPMRWLLHPDNPWTLRQEIIWDRKSTHNHSATLFWPEDERIYWLTKGKPVIRAQSIGRSTIWSEFGPVPNTWHPAPFTDKLPRMLLEAIGVDVETTVLDPFAGSCTTLKVAVEMGCQGVGVDISREYLERAIVENGWSHECLY